MTSFDDFKTSVAGESAKELRAMAAKELDLKLPKGLPRDQLLAQIYQSVSGEGGKDDRAASPAVSPPPESTLPEPAPAGYRVKHMQRGGTNRAGRHWPIGPTVTNLTEAELKALQGDHRFTVVKL